MFLIRLGGEAFVGQGVGEGDLGLEFPQQRSLAQAAQGQAGLPAGLIVRIRGNDDAAFPAAPDELRDQPAGPGSVMMAAPGRIDVIPDMPEKIHGGAFSGTIGDPPDLPPGSVLRNAPGHFPAEAELPGRLAHPQGKQIDLPVRKRSCI